LGIVEGSDYGTLEFAVDCAHAEPPRFDPPVSLRWNRFVSAFFLVSGGGV
jgi:hypothetical protein